MTLTTKFTVELNDRDLHAIESSRRRFTERAEEFVALALWHRAMGVDSRDYEEAAMRHAENSLRMKSLAERCAEAQRKTFLKGI